MKKIVNSNYLINSSTLIVENYKDNKSRVYEFNKDFVISTDLCKIISDSCNFYGSTYDGRLSYSKNILNMNIKLPIIIEESKNLIFFPTKSFYNEKCVWISFNNLDRIEKSSDGTIIYFKENKKVIVDASYDIIQRQLYNCLKLEKELFIIKQKA